MEESQNVFDLLGKIEWEGGMMELITGYGMSDIDEYNVPEHLKEMWEEVATAAGSVAEDMDELYHAINTYATKYGNKELDEED